MANKWVRNEVKEIIFYLALIAIGGILLEVFAGFFLGAYSESFQPGASFSIGDYFGRYVVYTPLLIGAILLIIFPIARLVTLSKNENPATQKKPSWFTIFTVSYIFSPEEGMLYKLFKSIGFSDEKNPMNWSISIIRCIIIGILIFGALGIAQISYPQLNIAGVPHPAQTITTGSDIIFGSVVPALAENGVLLFLMFFLLGIGAYISSKFKLGLVGFFTIGVIICVFIGFTWAYILHHLIYGNSEAQLTATLVFGIIGAMLTLFLGNLIWFFLWHVSNNLFIILSKISTVHADLILISILVWVGILIAYIIGEILVHRVKKKFNPYSI